MSEDAAATEDTGGDITPDTGGRWIKAIWCVSAAGLLTAALAHAQPAATITLGDYKSLAPQALAARILPPDMALQVSGGLTSHQVFVGGQVFDPEFWSTAKPDGPDLCTRQLYTLTAANRTTPYSAPDDTVLTISKPESAVQYAPSYPDVATPQRCAEVGKNWLGFITPFPAVRDYDLRVLRLLTSAMAAAKATGPLSFHLACEPLQVPVCQDPRHNLAELPLYALLGVGPASGWTTGDQNHLEIRFFMSPSDGRSWFVILTITNDRVEAVQLMRDTVIYH